MSVMTYRATGAAAVAGVVAPGVAFQIECIRIHLSAAGGAVGNVNLIATIDAGAGATYDTVILTQDMTAITDLVWQPTRPIRCTFVAATVAASDHIDIVYANGSNRDYGLTVNYSII